LQPELAHIRDLARADAIAVWQVDPEVDSLQIIASSGLSREYVEYGNTTAVTPMSKAFAPIYRSLSHGFPVAFVEPKKIKFKGIFEEWSTLMSFNQIATFPVVVQTAIIGVVSLYFVRTRDDHEWQHSLSFGLFVDRIARRMVADLPASAAPEFAAFEAKLVIARAQAKRRAKSGEKKIAISFAQESFSFTFSFLHLQNTDDFDSRGRTPCAPIAFGAEKNRRNSSFRRVSRPTRDMGWVLA
jgi:hypothetical protein